MNSALVSRLLAVVPERVARASSGTLFEPGNAACTHPERIALVSRYLNWMSPLNALTKDEQRELGLIGPGRAVGAAEGEGWEPDEPLGAVEADETEAPAVF